MILLKQQFCWNLQVSQKWMVDDHGKKHRLTTHQNVLLTVFQDGLHICCPWKTMTLYKQSIFFPIPNIIMSFYSFPVFVVGWPSKAFCPPQWSAVELSRWLLLTHSVVCVSHLQSAVLHSSMAKNTTLLLHILNVLPVILSSCTNLLSFMTFTHDTVSARVNGGRTGISTWGNYTNMFQGIFCLI